MNYEHFEKLKTTASALLLIAVTVLLSFMVGCVSLQPTQAEQKIDAVIDSHILDPSHIVSLTDKAQIKTVLVAAKTEIRTEQIAEVDAKKSAASNALWAHRGKEAAGIGIFLMLVCIGRIIWRIIQILKVPV